MPVWPNSGQYGWCKWCGERIPVVIDGKRSTQRMWHPNCWRECCLHTRMPEQYDHVVARDGERCAICSEKPMRWWSNRIDVVTHVGPSMPWKGPRVGNDYIDALLQFRRDHWGRVVWWEIERKCALELDHRVPLWSVADLPDESRRPYFYVSNLWLLCPKHHQMKSAREATQRAAEKALIRDQLALPL